MDGNKPASVDGSGGLLMSESAEVFVSMSASAVPALACGGTAGSAVSGLSVFRLNHTGPVALPDGNWQLQILETLLLGHLSSHLTYSGLRNYSPPWHFSYFVALQPGIEIDFLGVCIT